MNPSLVERLRYQSVIYIENITAGFDPARCYTNMTIKICIPDRIMVELSRGQLSKSIGNSIRQFLDTLQ